jgi:hypothetical protein
VNLIPAELTAHLSWAGYALILTAALLGALVQGSIGFGAAMVTVPVLAFVTPEALPAGMIVSVVPLTIAQTLRDRAGVDWSGVSWMTLGRLPGSAIGAWTVTAVAQSTIAVLAGGAVLVGVGASLFAAAIPLTRPTKITAGFASGAMGTATSIGGPPVALLYQHADGLVVRGTLAASFAASTTISVVMLALTGAIELWQVALGMAMMPGLAAGLALSSPLARCLDKRWLRPAVLAFVAVTAILTIVQGL